jgi:hypothetical protein
LWPETTTIRVFSYGDGEIMRETLVKIPGVRAGIRTEGPQNTNVEIFLNWCRGNGVELGPLDTAATNRAIVPAPSNYDDGEIGGMVIGRGTKVFGENLLHCRYVHHEPHMSARSRTRAAAVGSQRLTA